MDRTAGARAEVRQPPTLDLLGLALAIAAVIVAFVGTSGSGSALSAPSSPSSPGALPSVHGAAIGEADGLFSGEVSVFDDVPAVANLDPSLLDALRRAATAAARNGVELRVNSGWRSPEYQELLLRQAVSEYGSEAAAARWVGTAKTSAHVSGDAVDVGPARATAWLRRHGARFGLCQIYRNEPWHFELRPEATIDGCPAMYADPTRDPRMQP
jgi:zinc D-Ala-D-Ala carboxypeptidase